MVAIRCAGIAARICTVDVRLQRVLVLVEGGHIGGLAAHAPIPVPGKGAVRIVGGAGDPGVLVADGCAGDDRVDAAVGRILIFAGFCAQLHIFVQPYPGEDGRAVRHAGEVFNIDVLVAAVEVVVQTPAGVECGRRFVERLLADGLPGKGAAKRDNRRQSHRAHGGQRLFTFCCHACPPYV